MEFLDASGTALSQGDADKNQDGAALQLGYFTEATADNLFAGKWKKGSIPYLWDGNCSQRIVNILKK